MKRIIKNNSLENQNLMAIKALDLVIFTISHSILTTKGVYVWHSMFKNFYIELVTSRDMDKKTVKLDI
jgi:hypothetical protein